MSLLDELKSEVARVKADYAELEAKVAGDAEKEVADVQSAVAEAVAELKSVGSSPSAPAGVDGSGTAEQPATPSGDGTSDLVDGGLQALSPASSDLTPEQGVEGAESAAPGISPAAQAAIDAAKTADPGQGVTP